MSGCSMSSFVKTTIVGFASIILLLVVLVTPALAASAPEIDVSDPRDGESVVMCQGFEFVVRADYAVVVGSSSQNPGAIPGEVAGVPVRALASCAFETHALHADSLVVPASLTCIAPGALTRTLVAQIAVDPANEAFCSIGGVLFERTTDTLVRFPTGMPCESYAVPEGTLAIGEGAFAMCGGIEGLAIPSSVAVIGEGAFLDCVALTSIEVDAANMHYRSDKGVLFDRQGTLVAFPANRPGTSYEVPDGVAAIAPHAFASSLFLESLVVPPSVRSIGPGAFACCFFLRDAVINAEIDELPEQAFYSCYELARVTLPQGLAAIGPRAFAYCHPLTSIDLPSSVASISSDAFLKCPAGDGLPQEFASLIAAAPIEPAQAVDPRPYVPAQPGEIDASGLYDGEAFFVDEALGYEYVLRDGYAVIIRRYAEDENVVVPQELGGMPVKACAPGAFLIISPVS